jgi:hypothetical protein
MSILMLNVWVRVQVNTDRAWSHGGDENVQTVTYVNTNRILILTYVTSVAN